VEKRMRSNIGLWMVLPYPTSTALSTNATQSRLTAIKVILMKGISRLATVPIITLALIAVISGRGFGAEVTISGMITDSKGSRVEHGLVQAIPRGGNEQGGTVGNHPSPWIQADSRGRFKISLPPGRYKIHAKDDVDGYPDPVYLLNADSTAIFPEITVEEKDNSYVRVILGNRGGVLVGDLVDKESRDPVPHGKVTISDARNAKAYVEVFADASGHFQFPVPSKPLLLSATATGYSTTRFGGGTELTLAAGERREIVFELQRP
jgi:Carboxypeptidase regulatory-like domain